MVPRNEISAFFKSLDKYPNGFRSIFSSLRTISKTFTHVLDIVNIYFSEIAKALVFLGLETVKAVEFSTIKLSTGQTTKFPASKRVKMKPILIFICLPAELSKRTVLTNLNTCCYVIVKSGLTTSSHAGDSYDESMAYLLTTP